MKIRIKGNSLRYRLTRSDIAALVEDGYLREQTDFPGRSLVYAIKTTDREALAAEFVANAITLLIPKQMVEELVHTDRVGFEDKSSPLYLLVEKDFVCIDKVEEDQSDNYPHPLEAKTC